jgi:hypothetical protein
MEHTTPPLTHFPELATSYKALDAARAELQETVNRHLSPSVVAALLETRDENNEIDYTDLPLPEGPWFLIRVTTVSEDVAGWFLPGDHTVAADAPNEPDSLVAYSIRAGFDVIVDRRHVETVAL